jgi:hypothetical protein
LEYSSQPKEKKEFTHRQRRKMSKYPITAKGKEGKRTKTMMERGRRAKLTTQCKYYHIILNTHTHTHVFRISSPLYVLYLYINHTHTDTHVLSLCLSLVCICV